MKRRLLLALAVLPVLLLAHGGEPLEPHDWWTAWPLEPGTAIPLAFTALLYARGARGRRGVQTWEASCAVAGWVVLALALVSPLHPLGEVLFSAHMAQHEILMLVAAPLLVLSRPLVPLLWGLPLAWRQRAGRWFRGGGVQRAWRALSSVGGAWVVHAAALWCWHVPALFQATLRSELAHAAQHLSFFLSALLFWWSVFFPRSGAGYGSGVISVFTTSVHTSILGALLTFSRNVWYPAYLTTTAAWGLTPLEDQQIGGLIMWVPAGVVYLGAALWLLYLWLGESDASTRGRGSVFEQGKYAN